MKKESLFQQYGRSAWQCYPDYLRYTNIGSEADTLEATVSKEAHLYVPTQSNLIGGLQLSVGGKKHIDLDKIRKPFELPVWVEEDGLSLVKCSARGVLLVVNYSTFARFYKWNVHKELNVVLACSQGLPMYPLRRALHRLCKQFSLPLYLLADNDTWGYFIFSILKRGAIGPDFEMQYAAVRDTRFLGLRSGDLSKYAPEKQLKISWKKHWKPRLDALRMYRCFKSRAWQDEFDRFEAQHGKIEQGALGRLTRTQLINDYLRAKFERSDWLR